MSQTASNRPQVKVEVRKGARNPLRKADNYCHGTGRGRTREGCPRLRIQKRLSWSMSELNATTATFSLVEYRQGSHLAAVWRHDIDTAIEGLPKSIRRRWHSTLDGTQSNPGAACVGSTCGLQPLLEKVIFLAPESGQGPHSPCPSLCPPASCSGLHQCWPGSPRSLGASGKLSSSLSLISSSGTHNSSCSCSVPPRYLDPRSFSNFCNIILIFMAKDY